VNDHWDIVFCQEPGQEGLRGFGVPMLLEQNIEHEAVLVHGSPSPVSDAIDARTDLVQKPAGTALGFPLAQVFREERAEVDIPFAQRLVADLDAALVEQFLNISVAEREAVIQPHGVLDDGHWKAVPVGGGIGLWESA